MGGVRTYIGWAAPALLALAGCGDAVVCGAAECADVCARQAVPAPAAEAPAAAAPTPAPAAGGSMTPFEQELVGPLLDALRAGVVPLGDEGLGVCQGTGKDCARFLGRSPGELPKGEYSLQARLAVPDIGPKGTWTVSLRTACTTTGSDGEAREGKPYERSFDVIHAGPDRGYTLAPLYKISSPGAHGAQQCTYTLTAPHPDGDKVYEGSWSVPAE